MKRIKLFITVTAFLCALCICLAFAGCSTGGTYVENSFKAETIRYYSDYYTGSTSLSVSGSFEVILNKAGEYTVEYDVCQTDTNGNVLAKKTVNYSLTRKAETDKNEYTVQVDTDIPTTTASENVKIENVTVTLDNATPDYYAYAIGFGGAGAVILLGLIIVFVLDKQGKLKKIN